MRTKYFLIILTLAGLAIPLACSNNNNPTSPAPTATFTFTPTTWAKYTATPTPTPTSTATSTATNLNGYTSTFTPTVTSTPTNVTATNTPTSTPTNTGTNTTTSTATVTPTNTIPFSPTPTYATNGPSVRYPNGVAVNAAGTTLYVAEGDGISTDNQVQIFNGTSLVNTLTTYGSTAFVAPNGVALNSAGTTFYVVDSGNSSFGGAVYGFTASGAAAVSWSSWTGGTVTSFSNPEGIAVDPFGNVYVADTGNNTVEEFTSTGSEVTQWGSFNIPSAVAAVTLAGPVTNIYVANAGNGSVSIYTSPSWTAGPTVANSDLFGIAVDGSGNIYLADTGNSLVEEYNGTNLVTEWNGSPGPLFVSPDGIALTGSGGIWVTDFENGPSGTGTLNEF